MEKQHSQVLSCLRHSAETCSHSFKVLDLDAREALHKGRGRNVCRNSVCRTWTF